MEQRIKQLTLSYNKNQLRLPQQVDCKNSYERMLVHTWAEERKISHHTIIDYLRYHKISTGRITVRLVPFSCVVISNNYKLHKQHIIVGDPMIHDESLEFYKHFRYHKTVTNIRDFINGRIDCYKEEQRRKLSILLRESLVDDVIGIIQEYV